MLGNAVRVIGAIEGYITTFFTCTVCAEHFSSEIMAWKNVGSAGQTVFGMPALALWEIHNRVNFRLGSDPDEVSNDPVHPKDQFPLSGECSSCRDRTGYGYLDIIFFVEHS